MKIKRIIAASAVILCLFLSACSDSEETSAPDAVSDESQETPAVTLPSDAVSESSGEDEETPSESGDSETDETEGKYAPAVWLVTSPSGGSIYMMGSMHALTEDCYPLPDYVLNIYEQADVLAVECDVTDATALFSAGVLQLQNLYYDDGTELSDHLSEETYEGISGYLGAHGENADDYSEYQLWYISSVLELLAIEDAGLDSDLGLDQQLLISAHDDEKEIYEIETAEFQTELLIGFSDETYDLLLSDYSADNTDEITLAYTELYEAWRTGDLAAIEESNETDVSELDEEQARIIADYNDQMLTERNAGMAQQAMSLADDGRNTLFVVGAAHFVGENGIIALLQNEGYSVERIYE